MNEISRNISLGEGICAHSIYITAEIDHLLDGLLASNYVGK